MDTSCNIDSTQIYTLQEIRDDYPGGIIQAIGELPILNNSGNIDSTWLEDTIRRLYTNKVLPRLIPPTYPTFPTIPSFPILPPTPPPPPPPPTPHPGDLGCWTDTWDRMFSTNHGRPNTVEQCIKKAKNNGHKYAGIQDGNECYTGNDSDNWRRYGRASGDCPPTGAAWKSHVYSAEDVPPLQPRACESYGYTDPVSNNVRSYTKDECLNNMGGVWRSPGVCYKNTNLNLSDSWSIQCAYLNANDSTKNKYNQEVKNYQGIIQLISDMKKAYNDAATIFNQKNDAFKNEMKTQYCFYSSRLVYTKKSFVKTTADPEVNGNNKMVKYKYELIEKLKLKMLILTSIASKVYQNNISLIEGFEGSMGKSDNELKKQHTTLTNEITASKLNNRMVDYTLEKNKANQNLLTLFGILNIVAVGIIYGIASS